MIFFFLMLMAGFNYIVSAQSAIIASYIFNAVVLCFSGYYSIKSFEWRFLGIVVCSLLEFYFLTMLWMFLLEKEQIPTFGFFGLLEILCTNLIVILARKRHV